jgi:hypothetical protein
VVPEPLSERVGEPGEPTALHPHLQALPLDVGGGHAVGIGAVSDIDSNHPYDPAPGLAAGGVGPRLPLVLFYELSEVHLRPERQLDAL